MEFDRVLRVLLVVMLVSLSDHQFSLGDGSTSTIRRGGAELTSRASRKLLDFPHGRFVGRSMVHSDPRPPFINPGPLVPSPPPPSTLRSQEEGFVVGSTVHSDPRPPFINLGPLVPSPPPPSTSMPFPDGGFVIASIVHSYPRPPFINPGPLVPSPPPPSS